MIAIQEVSKEGNYVLTKFRRHRVILKLSIMKQDMTELANDYHSTSSLHDGVILRILYCVTIVMLYYSRHPIIVVPSPHSELFHRRVVPRP